MRLRLRNLETAVSRVEDVVEADQRMAETLKRVWAYEYASRLSEGEQRLRFELAREVHAANPDVADEVQALIADEVAYVEARADDHIAGLRRGERSRWRSLLRGDAIG